MSILFRKHFHPSVSLANLKEKPVENGLLYLAEFFRHFEINDEEKIQQALTLFEPRIYRKNSWSTSLNMRFREDTIVLEISHENFAGFILQNKPFADMFMKIMVDIMSSINEHNQLLKLPTRSRFEYLLKMKPEVFNRFLLQDIASFIGVKQETLSRARKYFSRKKSSDVTSSSN